MNRVCPKCEYKRSNNDTFPSWGCPACGVAYNKVVDSSQLLRLKDYKRCPKCDYIRNPIESTPAWQCPSCKVAYTKVSLNTHTVKTNWRLATTVPSARIDHYNRITILVLIIGILVLAGTHSPFAHILVLIVYLVFLIAELQSAIRTGHIFGRYEWDIEENPKSFRFWLISMVVSAIVLFTLIIVEVIRCY